MPKIPQISIIIPTYNSSAYIEQALNSVWQQTFTDYEIIVIDDGSTDGTGDKLNPYKSRIRYFYQDNQGSAAARNTGINLAKGNLIAFLDADDYWLLANKLELQVNYFNERSSLGLINTGWRVVDSKNNKISTVQPWHEAPDLNLETWLRSKCVRTSSLMIRRKWLERVKGFDEALRQSHDVDLVLRLALAGCEAAWLKQETVAYRQHEGNTTNDGAKQAQCIQAVLDKFFARPDLPDSVKLIESETRYHTLVWLGWYQYHRGNLDGMAQYLAQSLDYNPYLRAETLANWIASFTQAAQSRGQQLDADALTDTVQWQRLTSLVLGLKLQLPSPSQPKTAPQSVEVVSPKKPSLTDTFVFYRILGNDLPPRHKKGQTLSNIKFILEHEPKLANCEKRWIINRIVDSEQEKAVINLLEQYQQTYLRIPFVESEYAAIEFNFDDFPESNYFQSKSYQKLHDFAQALAIDHTYHYKNLYVMHNNGGRNAALQDGRTVAKWVLPWDGNCFLTEKAWQQIVDGIQRNPETQYFIVPMARILNNQDLLNPDFEPDAAEEPQIIFRNDAPGEFNGNMRYGRLPKIEMLWRLQVPGVWDKWKKSYPWEKEDFNACLENSKFDFAGWVARLSSGMHQQERDATKRGWSRFAGIHSVLDSLDLRIAQRHQGKENKVQPDPNIAQYYYFLGDTRAEEDKLEIAINFYRLASQYDPQSWQILRKLGKALQKSGDLEGAFQAYSQAIAINPQISMLHSDIGSIYSQQGEFERAIPYYSRSIELNPKDRWSYYKLADAQEHQWELEAAAKNLKIAVEIEPNFVLAYRNLARIQQMLGNLSETISCYQQIIKIDPDVELNIYQSLALALQQNSQVKARAGLGNLPQKLAERPCKIAYLGGSPTAQNNGYRPLLHQWFRDTYQQDHQEINAGNGGITSSAAAFTMDDTVIRHQPDLCFIEYCTSDMGKNQEIGAAVEGMVRKLVAINCQVCLLYLYKTDQKFDYTNETIIEYEKIADFYQIPSINVGQYLEELFSQEKFGVKELFSNKEKTSESGSKVTSDFIIESLEKIFRKTEEIQSKSGFINRLAKTLYDNHYGVGKIINIDPSFIRDRDRYTIGEFKKYQYYQIDSSNEIKFTIEGNLVGLATIVGPESGIIELVTPERTWEYKLWDAFCFQDRYQVKIINRNFDQSTPVKLKLTEQPIDYSQCRQKLENPEKIVKNFKLVGLLVCGEIS
ncbi:MAG: hypothetical protein Tsb0014_12550 [Pleurocapsa sp.]